MFHLAPVGIDSRSRVKKDKHQEFLNDVKACVKACLRFGQNEVPGREVEAVELLRTLDSFLSHGFLVSPKCYWLYVKEFIPHDIQRDLQIEWQTKDDRKLSVGWLKTTLNNKTLNFEFLSFVAQPSIIKKHYDKNAAMRNQALLKMIAVGVDPLSNVNFKFISPAYRESQEIPLAQFSTQAPIYHVPSSTAIQPRTISRRRLNRPDLILSASVHAADSSSSFRVGSFDHPGPKEDREEEDEDLPRVELPQSANEPFLSTTRDQEYILDAMIKNHRQRIQSSARFESDSEEEAPKEEDSARRMSSSPSKTSRRRSIKAREKSMDASIPSSPSSSTSSGAAKSTNVNEEVKEEENLLDDVENGNDEVSEEVFEHEVEENGVDHNEEKDEKPEFEKFVIDEPIEGNLQLISGEIVNLAMQVFRQDSERYQAMFSIYVNYAVGEPQRRFLLLTDQCIYLLKAKLENTEEDTIQASSYTVAGIKFDSLSKSLENMSPIRMLGESSMAQNVSLGDNTKYKYETEVFLNLNNLDCISIGISSQSLCFHSTNKQIFAYSPDRREKQFQIETASQNLAELIVFKLNTIVKNKFRHLLAIDRNQNTFGSIIMHNFVRKELALPQVEIKRASLVYWLQSIKESEASRDTMESYIFVRNVYPSAWRKKMDDWTQSYFIMREHMLYQFTDSTCKEAISSVDLREKVELLEQVELKNDENFVFQLTLTEEPFIQFSFETSEEMNKWITAMRTAINSSHALELDSVACLVLCTDTTILFVQEGANFLVDGFVRSLHKISLREVHSVSSAKSTAHRLIAIQRESGDSEWVFFRNDTELYNFVTFLQNEWGLKVEEHGENWMESDNVHGKIYRQYLHKPDFFQHKMN
ncbi:unnamed protein product [Bursaphelenchus okinawaensis]|uniref:PH domain-containing protein n=1 Tax=Bursaphelenchus okinawaensis TaxID=465554 RepID=A0A811K9D9_9BILA|nr:unnamed protein product [Bursaphelenchus okinawaensis]CAG9095706.1 unnamed protein product [Bursaphelenchus okinawaensis]